MNSKLPDFVWCWTCRKSRPVKSEYAYQHGYPKCCDKSMLPGMPPPPRPKKCKS